MVQSSVIRDPHKTYGRRKTSYTQLIYIIASFLWIMLICAFDVVPDTLIGWLLFLLPLVVFFVSFSNADQINTIVEEDMFNTSHLDLGLVIVLSLFAWISKDYSGDQRKFVSLLIVAIILSLLGVIDVWMSKKWIPLIKHIKSALQTLSISILIYALYLYYCHRRGSALP